MKISSLAILGISLMLGSGCGGDDESTAGPQLGGAGSVGAAGTAPAGAAGSASVATAGSRATAAAGTSAASAGAGARAGAGASGTSAAPAPVAGAPAPAAAGAAAAAGTGAAVAGAGAAPAAGAGAAPTEPPASSAGKLPRVMTTDGPGPFTEVVKVMNTPPGGWMIYPKEIGKDGIKHPLFVFGPGGGTTPSTYEMRGMHWDRYGSYGFVIYVLPQSTGDGSAMKAGLDWLIEQNTDMASPLFGHLDTSKVTAAGHSQGSITTFDFMPDDRVTTTIHISGGSSGGSGPAKLTKDTMFLCGPSASADVAYNQCETDFAATTVPTYYTKIEGSGHETSGRLGWAAIIAWMLWHMADQEDQWKKEFLEPTGLFQTGIYKSQIKNW